MSSVPRGAVLGVAVAHNAVRVLFFDGKSVAWTHEAAMSSEEELEACLSAVLGEACERYGSRRAAIAVGPTFAQFRHLSRLPMVRDARTLSVIVQQSAGRYFRQNGKPVVTTPVAGREHDRAWAGAIEEPTVSAILDACRAVRLKGVAIVPAVAILGEVVPTGVLRVQDGDVALELRYEGRRLRECRAVPSRYASDQLTKDQSFDAALLALGERAPRFADAYAAARGGWKSEFAIRPKRVLEQEPGKLRLALAATACTSALLLTLIAPLLNASRRQAAAERRWYALAHVAAVPLRTEQALADSARLLVELTSFSRGAVATTLLLAALTRAITKPTVLLSLRLDREGGSLTALTRNGSELLATLASVRGISAPAIVGAVTPAPSDGVSPPSPLVRAPSDDDEPQPPQMVHVMVRFHWSGERPRPASPSRALQ